MSHLSLIASASRFAFAAHESIGQKRKYTGEPYWKHPDRVADILRDHHCSEEVIAAAYLHDILEDVAPKRAEWGADAIRDQFGQRVLDLVREVSDVSKPSDGNRETRKAIDREHYAEASPDGQSIKLADLIDNTRDITAHDPDFAVTYLREKALLLPMLKSGKTSLWLAAMDALDRAKSKLGIE